VRVDVEKARRRAEGRGRQIRIVGAYGTQDMSLLEDRTTGERRRVPNKWLLLARSPAVAFEMVPAGPGFEDEAPAPDEDEE
jgi:hypothetical protein